MLNTSAFTSSYSLVKQDHDGEPASLYRYLAWEGAFSTIVVRWFQGGRKESIDFMAEFCSQVPGILVSGLFIIYDLSKICL